MAKKEMKGGEKKMSERLSKLESIYHTGDFHVVLVFWDPVHKYAKKVKIDAPCEFYRYKSDVPHLICLEYVDYYRNVLLTEEELAEGKDEEYQSEYLHQLYYIDFKAKSVDLIFETNGKILDYNSDFVFYVPKKRKKSKKSSQYVVVRNLHTNKEYKIALGFEVKEAKVGSKYAVFYGGDSYRPFFYYDLYFGVFQDPFAIYDLEQKQFIHQVMTKNTKNILNVSNDFLNGKTSLYYVERPIDQDFNVCSIYNKGKLLGEVKYYYAGILVGLKNMLVNNFLITEKTQYVSDVDRGKGLIRFYKLKEDGLEPVNTLYECYGPYGTHLFSCGTKFLIYKKTGYTKKGDEIYSPIFLYDVNKGEIEYEKYYTDIVSDLHIIKFGCGDEAKNEKFITDLLLYAHGSRDIEKTKEDTKDKHNCIDNKVIFEKVKKSEQSESLKPKV